VRGGDIEDWGGRSDPPSMTVLPVFKPR
jgi:hypothetical protein